MSADIRFFEVGPRDGLQNEEAIVGVDDRVTMIEKLVDTGVTDIEIGSFVHPKWVPQMEGTDEVAQRIDKKEGVRYWALVPNLRGLKRAVEAEIEHVAVFMSATEAHNQKNLNRSLDESLVALAETISEARDHDITVRAYISTAFGCPFEGEVDFDRVLDIGEQLLEMGAHYLSLGDTIGVGSPPQIRRGCRRAVDIFGAEQIGLHLHDTQGLAVANALVAYEAGVRIFDGAVGGMGGCPYAPGAAGNVASEDLLNLFLKIGADCNVDRDKMSKVAYWLERQLGFSIDGQYYNYWQANQEPQR